MHKTLVCALCDSHDVRVETYSERVRAGRRFVEVDGLQKIACAECGSDFVTEEMHDANLLLVQQAIEGIRAAVPRGLLVSLREGWGLSQRDASSMFGGGAASFAKWESGQNHLSTPSALLIQCAAKFPEVVRYLATMAHVVLPTGPVAVIESKIGGYETVRVSVGNCSNSQDYPPPPRGGRHRASEVRKSESVWTAEAIEPAWKAPA